MKTGRREFVSGGGLALAGMATGTIVGLSSSPASASDDVLTNRRIAGFGWELSNLDNNGADVYFEVVSNMILNSASIDVAFMITSRPPARDLPRCCAGPPVRAVLPSSPTGIPAPHLSPMPVRILAFYKATTHQAQPGCGWLLPAKCFLQRHPEDLGAR